MTKFRFIGHLEFLGRTVPLDLWFDCSETDLADALAGLIVYPDDPNWPMPTIPELDDKSRPAAETRPGIADPNLFAEMDDLDDARKWQYIADHHSWLFRDDSPEQAATAVPALVQPPGSLKDIQKIQRQQANDVDDLEADLAKLRQIPREHLLKTDGTINTSEVARSLGYRAGGGKWEYFSELAAILQAEYDDQDLAAGNLDQAEEAA